MPHVCAASSSELKHDSVIDTYFRLLCQHEILKVIGLPNTANSPLVYRSIAGRIESQHRANLAIVEDLGRGLRWSLQSDVWLLLR